MTINTNELLERLLETDGVEKVHVETTITVTHRQESTSEVDDVYNPIRERVIDESQFKTIASKFGWNHIGTVDVPNDFELRDRFTHRVNIEGESDE